MSLYEGYVEPLKNEEIPTLTNNLTWSDFGITCGGQQTSVSGVLSNQLLMSDSLFDGDIIMQTNSNIRYGGYANYTGLIITVNESGNIVLSGGDAWIEGLSATEFTPEAFELDSFANTRFNLKIAVTELDIQSETKSAKVRIWINGILLGDSFTLKSSTGFGGNMSLYEGYVEPLNVE